MDDSVFIIAFRYDFFYKRIFQKIMSLFVQYRYIYIILSFSLHLFRKHPKIQVFSALSLQKKQPSESKLSKGFVYRYSIATIYRYF